MPLSARHLFTRVWVEVSEADSLYVHPVNVDGLAVGQGWTYPM